MTRFSPKAERLARFILMLRRNSPARINDTTILDSAAELIRQAKISQRLNLAECERDLSAPEQRRRQLIREFTSAALLEIWGNGARFECTGDPRGAAIKLFPGDGETNCFAGEGFAVPID